MRTATAILVVLSGLSCGGGGPYKGTEASEGEAYRVQPEPKNTVVRPKQETPPPKPKTLEDVEKELGLAPGSLKSELEAEYQADTGDVLGIQCQSHPKLTQDATVSPDGRIALTGIGTLEVRGQTLPQIERAIATAAASAGLRNPRFSVSVKTVAKKFVTFVGPQMTGGRIEIGGHGTLLETLAGSGWKPDRRAARRIAVLRNGRTAIIDIDQITALSSVNLNIKLHANDIVLAMEKDPVEAKGSIAFPGTYAIPPSGTLEVRDLIALAGGLKYPLDVRSVQILHLDGQSETIDMNEYLFAAGQKESRVLKPGDTIYFPAHREFSIYVLGMVKKPGLHKVAGAVTVSRALALADNEKFGAVTSDSRLVRGYPEKPQVIRIDFDALFQGETRYDVLMGDGDVLYVPESFGAQVLETIDRIFRPLSGAVPTAVQIYTATQIGK